MLTLSDRLQAIADRVLPGRPVVDVGTDHGWLPIHLVHHGIVTRAIAVDRRSAPLAAARRHAAQAELHGDGRLSLRQGDGLSVVTPVELGDVGTVEDGSRGGTIVIAGMGGPRIVSLLRARPDVLEEAGRLVLQPNTDLPGVRAALETMGWTLVDEVMVDENGQRFTTLVAEPAAADRRPLTAAERLLGPCLLRDRPPLFDEWLGDELVRLDAVLVRAAGSPAEAELRRQRALVAAALADGPRPA